MVVVALPPAVCSSPSSSSCPLPPSDTFSPKIYFIPQTVQICLYCLMCRLAFLVSKLSKLYDEEFGFEEKIEAEEKDENCRVYRPRSAPSAGRNGYF